MGNVVNLRQTLRSLAADPTTAGQPIKRTFLYDGEHISANIAVIDDVDNALHTQPAHDEIVVVIEGTAGFRVGDDTYSVSEGDLIFIPRNTVHGPVVARGQRFAALSVFAPYFDRTQENIRWQRNQI